MSWEIKVGDEFTKGTLREIVERAISYVPDGFSPRDVDKAVNRAIDEECCYYTTMLEIIHHMGMTSEAFALVEDEFTQEVWEIVAEEVGDERMDENYE